MKFEKTYVSNFEGAFRGLRNPLESWNKSDSIFGIDLIAYSEADYQVAAEWVDEMTDYDYDKDYDNWYSAHEKYDDWLITNGVLTTNHDMDIFEYAFIGPKDLDLAHRMIKAGTSDSKFLRQINVSVDITAPLYWC